MIARALLATLLSVLALAGAACDPGYPTELPPGDCVPGELVCYYETVNDRLFSLRCVEGELYAATWLIDDTCVDGELCVEGACVLP